MFKKLLVSLSAALLIFACSTFSNTVSINGKAMALPQMYTEEMLTNKPLIEEEFNVTFLGAYTPGANEWIMWATDNATGLCHAHIISPALQTELSCDDAYEIYRAVCLEVGNCI